MMDFHEMAREFIQPDCLSPDPDQVEALRHDLAALLRQVWEAGLAAGASGNVPAK